LKCTHELVDLRKRFSDNLFFKYIAQKESLVEDQTFELKSIGLTGKVLLIDDQAEQGWSNLYRSLLRLSDNVSFEYVKGIVETKEIDQIIEMCMVEIEKIDPDVILLDLKLHDNEISQENNLSSTGMKILKMAMNLNRGFSIIITSADRNANVINSALAAGAGGFILKDWKIDPLSTLNAAFAQISKGLQRSSYLKKVSRQIKQILLNLENSSLSDGFRENARSSLNIAFDFLRKSFEENRFQNYAYLQFFLIIEDFIRETCSEQNDGFYINDGDSSMLVAKRLDNLRGSKKRVIYDSVITYKISSGHYVFEQSQMDRYLDTNFKMSAILMLIYGLKESSSDKFQWPRVSRIRNNKCGHGMDKRVKEKEIFLILDFIEKIFDSNNFSNVNRKKAFTLINMNEKLEMLKNKFK
jgi:DNA-binding NarL/FixJ family response regulator